MAERNLQAEAKEDFKIFLLLMWKHLGLPAPTRAQYAFADHLQHGPRLRVLMAFRGVGKSWLTAGYVLWRLWVNPNRKVLVLSASADRATAFSTFLKRVISEWPMVNHLSPRPGQRDSVENFDVGPARAAQAPSVKSSGITGQITGTRGHDVVLDDCEVPKNSETVTQREKLANLTKEVSAILIPDSDLGEGDYTTVTVLGTPQCEDTLYAKYHERGYDVKIWPARYPGDDIIQGYETFGGSLFPQLVQDLADGSLEGDPTDKRFDDLDLMKREQEYGRSGFQLQFQLNPAVSDAERYPLKIRDLVVMDLAGSDIAPSKVVWSGSPEYTIEHLPSVGMAGDRWQGRMIVYDEQGKEPGGWAPYTGTVMAVDPSGRGKDETTACVVSYLNGYLFLREMAAFRGDGYSDQVLSALAEMANKYPGRAFQVEANYGDGMFTRLWNPWLQKIANAGLSGDQSQYEVKHNTQKELRIIDSLGPVLAQHKLIVDTEVVKADYRNCDPSDSDGGMRRCFFQMTRLTADRQSLKYDDRLDALAMAVRYWTHRMGVDADENIKQANWDALQEDAERTLRYYENRFRPATLTVGAKFGV